MKDVQTQSYCRTTNKSSQTPPRVLKFVYDLTKKYKNPVLYESEVKVEKKEKPIPLFRKDEHISDRRSNSTAKRVEMVDLSEAMVNCFFFNKIILS